jgi:hypothetical protein
MATHDEYERAGRRARIRAAKYPRAVSVRYERAADRILIALRNGVEIRFPPSAVEGLAGARPEQLRRIEITPSGFGIHFPELDADVYLPSLLEGVTGSQTWAAARMGKAGGEAKSAAKAAASRKNGKLGGRPRKIGA